VIIPNGVDVTRFQPRPKREDIRHAWGVDNEHYLFGLIGRLDRQKGSMEFVEAAAEVLRTFPNARFVMVGGNTLGEEEFDRLILDRLRALSLTGVVMLTDFRKDIPAVMNALDAFVMPSYEENFANVMLEALASGLPCIGTRSGGTPELLDHGQAGLLCTPQSALSLSESMAQLLSDPGLNVRLRVHARERALNEYDMSLIFRRIEDLVREK
jgi:glycosyltransferase involved in cell wall biosynthesis